MDRLTRPWYPYASDSALTFCALPPVAVEVPPVEAFSIEQQPIA